MIEEKIKQIMVQIFEISPDSINENSSQKNIENWDSLRHLNFVVELEDAFDISFEPEQIAIMISYKSVLEIVKQSLNG